MVHYDAMNRMFSYYKSREYSNRSAFVHKVTSEEGLSIREAELVWQAFDLTDEKRQLRNILEWFNEYDPSGDECFYQVDHVNLALPELGIACFQDLTKLGLYKPKD